MIFLELYLDIWKNLMHRKPSPRRGVQAFPAPLLFPVSTPGWASLDDKSEDEDDSDENEDCGNDSSNDVSFFSFFAFSSFTISYLGEARLAEWLRRRGASPGVLGSIPGAGNSLPRVTGPWARLFNAKATLAPNLISKYLLFGWRHEGHPADHINPAPAVPFFNRDENVYTPV